MFADPVKWFETLGVIGFTLVGIRMGILFGSGSRKNQWIAGLIVPSLVLFLLVLGQTILACETAPPFVWIVSGRNEYFFLGLFYPWLLIPLAGKLKTRRTRILIHVFLSQSLIIYTLLPFLLPAMMAGYYSQLDSVFLPGGICLQSTGHTCGPAAAVTALKQMGIASREGELARMAATSPITGTQTDLLCRSLNRFLVDTRRIAEFKRFRSMPELSAYPFALVCIRLNLWTDHIVTVMNVSDSGITIADPLKGRVFLTRKRFERQWNQTAIIFRESDCVDHSRSIRSL